jgi:flagellar biosynthesis/type III secretory pathway chaperone
MNLPWQPIADDLRAELGGYGDLLRLFEEQRRLLFARDPEAVLRLSDQIQEHVAGLDRTRRLREARVAECAAAAGQPRTASLRSLLPAFAPEARPLLQALIDEVNVLIRRVRQVSRHNHTLLQRAVETHQQLLRVLRPDSFVQTYGAGGRVLPLAAVRTAPALDAAG